MLNYVLKPIKHKFFYKKYAGKKYRKVGGILCLHLTSFDDSLLSHLFGFTNGLLSDGQRVLKLHLPLRSY